MATSVTVELPDVVARHWSGDEIAGALAAALARQAATERAEAAPADEDILALAGGRRYTRDQRLALEMDNLAALLLRRARLLEATVSAAEVARLLGMTRQTAYERARAGAMIAVEDRGHLRFPLWQLDPEALGGVVPGLLDIYRALPLSEAGKLDWLTRPSRHLGGRTPIEALRAGGAAEVLALAGSLDVA